MHDRNNWLYDLVAPYISPPPTPETPMIYDHLDSFLSDEETDPETSPFYHHSPSPDQVGSNTSATPVASPPPVFHQVLALNAIQSDLDLLRDELIILRIDFHYFMDMMVEQLDYIYQHIYFASLPLDRRG